MALILSIGILLILSILLIAYICFRITFYVTKSQRSVFEEYPIPVGKVYEPWRNKMINWIQETRSLPFREYSINSHDGLTLYGKFYEYAPGATIELMIHGYRGNAERDLCGGVQRCFLLGRSVLLVDQRGSSKSEGNIISFGVNESKDAVLWAEHIVKELGEDIKIIL